MDVQISRNLTREIRNSQRTAQILLAVAQRVAVRVAANTPVDTGETRASTHAEGGHRSLSGRSVAARVVQSGAAVQQQFGNSREQTPARQFDRARGAT